MKTYFLTVRTAAGHQPMTWTAVSSAAAAEQVASLFEEPCGITVHKGVR